MTASLQSIYRRVRYGKPVVVVSGLPRSGTSMAMKMLEAGGMPILADHVRTADIDNPKGYYELERVKDLDKEQDKSWLREGRGQAVKIISFLLPHLPPDLNYQVIFMSRHLQEVLASQGKMLDNRGTTDEADDERMRTLYEGHLWRVRYLLKHNARFAWLDVPYRAALDSPREQANRINEFLGGTLDVDKMVEVVDKSLYRNRASAG